MGKRRPAAYLHNVNNWINCLHKDETLSILQIISFQDILTKSVTWGKFLRLFHNHFPPKKDVNQSSINEAHVVIRKCLNIIANDPLRDSTKIRSIFSKLLDDIRLNNIGQLSSHSTKRNLVHSLGLLKKPYSVLDILNSCCDTIRVIWRTRTSEFKSRLYLTELPTSSPDSILVSEKTGFHIVHPEESVIFLSGNKDSFEVEMVILRNVANQSKYSSDLFEWLTAVVDAACRDRRDVRPNHEGHMAQIGLNMGPRNARILGYAKSFTKNLSEAQKVEKDEEIIGAASLFWSIVKSSVPSDVSVCVENYLNDALLPRLATRNVKEDTGFHLQLKDSTYFFPLQERGPPEVYMSKRYVACTHLDPAHCKYAFSFCVKRTIGNSTVTRPAKRTRYSSSEATSTTMSSSSFIDGGGANFVDASLKVVVKQAAATLMVFRPNFLHGTSLASGASNHAITIAFSQRVADAWKEKMLKEGVYLQKEVGEGNPDVLCR